jgi:glutamyl-tRNA(Gln) amidotransferase subunit E
MRPTLSELGEYDGTALMEYKTKKEIIYQINHDSVCTYEMDDTPPFEINQKALDIALQIGILLNYKLVSEIHIARKQYLDGSIPAGFQRTTIVGIDGWISFKNRKIGLIQLGLEEDACREISDIGHQRVFLTDRLGMPLIEMVTYPDMRTPQEVAQVANILRWSVRASGNMRNGIGAARQDVNVSIAGGTRIEIKGVYRIPLIPHLIYNEVLRQYSLLKIRDELKHRGISTDNFQANSKDVTHLLSNTSWDPIRRALKRDEKIYCVNLKGWRGILSYPVQTGKVFSREISDRVRVIACLTRQPNILTSESREETIDSYIWHKISKTIRANNKDAQILVWGDDQDLKTAVKEIISRAREATLGVPSETRQALIDGTNGFERILPGPNRMYPDTDLPPLDISEERINHVGKNVPKALWVREKEYRQMGVPEHLIILVAASPQAVLFESLVASSGISPVKITRFLFEKIKAWERKNLPTQKLNETIWNTIFNRAKNQPALLEKLEEIIEAYISSDNFDIESELSKYIPPKISEQDIKEICVKIIHDELPKNISLEKRERFLMGKIMEQCRGHIPGRIVRELTVQCLKDYGNYDE